VSGLRSGTVWGSLTPRLLLITMCTEFRGGTRRVCTLSSTSRATWNASSCTPACTSESPCVAASRLRGWRSDNCGDSATGRAGQCRAAPNECEGSIDARDPLPHDVEPSASTPHFPANRRSGFTYCPGALARVQGYPRSARRFAALTRAARSRQSLVVGAPSQHARNFPVCSAAQTTNAGTRQAYEG